MSIAMLFLWSGLFADVVAFFAARSKKLRRLL